MVLLIIAKTAINSSQGLQCTASERGEPGSNCEFYSFSAFLPAFPPSYGAGLWFSSASNQCRPGGIKLYYTPEGNPDVAAVMTRAAGIMAEKTADATVGGGLVPLAFAAIGVRSVQDVPPSEVEAPNDACTFFVDFSETCDASVSDGCQPWHFVVRPPFVPGGYNGARDYYEQRSWFTAIDTPCFNPKLSLGPRSYQGSGGFQAGNSFQFGSAPGYPNHAFLAIQQGITLALTQTFTPNLNIFSSNASRQAAFSAIEDMTIERLPYPEYYQSIWAILLPFFFPFLILFFASVALVIALVSDMVIEKERKLTITMKMMGLSSSHWRFSWFKMGLVRFFPVLTVIAVMSQISKVLPATFLVTLMYLWAFGLATISFAFLVASVSRVSTTSTLFSSIVWFLMLLPWIILYLGAGSQCNSVSKSTQGGLCFLAPSCASIGIEIMSTAAYTSSEISLSNFVENDVSGNISMFSVIVMLLFDALWMYLLSIYLENVRPGEFGTAESLLFPLHYILPFLKKEVQDADEAPYEPQPDGAVREQMANSQFGIEVRSLTKVYPPRMVGGNSFKAVDNLTLKMQTNQVTALLGQNGAGKSTTMNMLCGLFSPSYGQMRMNGRDLASHDGLIHRKDSLGVCPQHDVLWDALTVWEHLVFFAVIKGMPFKEAKQAADGMLAELALTEKRDVRTKALSGGQKRRLSVAIAMIGGSNIVILDEPTSGVDPQSARQIWELVQNNKNGRTILLSTHSMEEADVLSDRIAIIANGKLVCDGSAFFLKRHYGVGYTLTVSKSVGCDAARIGALVAESVRGAEITSDIGSELQIKMPQDESKVFPMALRELEKRQDDLRIDSMGISVTTMEEVFLQAALSGDSQAMIAGTTNDDNGAAAEQDTPMRPVGDFGGSKTLEDGESLVMASSSDLGTKLLSDAEAGRSGSRLREPATFVEQVSAIAAKNLMVARRNPFFSACMILIPFAFMVFGATWVRPPTQFNRLAVAPSLNLRPQGTVLLESPNCTSGLCAFARTTYLRQKGIPAKVVSSIPSYIGNLSFHETANFNKETRIGMTFSESGSSMKAYFNGQYYHSSAVAMKTVAAIVLANATSRNFDDLLVSNYPMAETVAQASRAGKLTTEAGSLWSQMNLFAQTIFTALLVYRPIRERAANAKLMQLVSGASYKSYWTGFFLVDFSLCFFFTILTLILLCSGSNAAVDGSLAGPLFLVTILYYSATVPVVYIVSCFMSTPAYGFGALFLVQYFMDINADFFSQTCSVQPGSWYCTAENAFLWLPIYCLTSGQTDLRTQTTLANQASNLVRPGGQCTTQSECCKIVGCPSSPFSMDTPGIGKQTLSLVLVAIAMWALLAFVETRLRHITLAMLRKKTAAPAAEIPVDADVRAEEERVLGGGLDDNIILREVGKHFGAKRAVDGITFGVPAGSCFGLLGVNGAGKTTTFKMITGEHSIGFGTIDIAGFDVSSELPEVQRRIGYVPQFDALVGDLNANELLAFYARLRGIPAESIPGVVRTLVDYLDLRKHCDRLCKTYSGGNKRKLSVACALIGDPQIILLDEPTTGMDPGGKRYLWNVILGLIEEGRSIVLTSHSMEECEALATQLTIMVDGRMRCFGSVQRLKTVHGSGYIIQIVSPDVVVPPEAEATTEETRVVGAPGQAPLPPGWEARQDQASGRWFYQNNMSMHTQWEHPNTLPPFWAERHDAEGKIYYQNETTHTTQWEHPGHEAAVAGNSTSVLSAVQSVQEFVPKIELKDVYGSSATFHLNDPSVVISDLFERLEELKQRGNIKEYSVGQASLESIFRSFAQQAQEQQLVTSMRERSGSRKGSRRGTMSQ